MSGLSLLSEQLRALGALVSEILENPDAPNSLKAYLETLAPGMRETLVKEKQAEIDALEAKVLLPEIMSRMGCLLISASATLTLLQ